MAKAIHHLWNFRRVEGGAISVPTGFPWRMSSTILARVPLAITIGMPACRTMRAAASLEAIPPVEVSLDGPKAIA